MSYHRPPPREVENFTGPFLVTLGLIFFMAFLTIAAVAGFLWVLLTSVLIERGIRLLAIRQKD